MCTMHRYADWFLYVSNLLFNNTFVQSLIIAILFCSNSIINRWIQPKVEMAKQHKFVKSNYRLIKWKWYGTIYCIQYYMDYILNHILTEVNTYMFWIYIILIFISGGSGIGFIIYEKYIEATIAFVICILFMVLLYFYLKRSKKKRNLDCEVIDCTDCSDCDCTN